MSGRKHRSDRDQRRRSLSQNFLVDQALISNLIDDLQIVENELVVDLGAGSGALTLPLARSGARVWAVERDPIWADRLASAALETGLDDRIRVIRADLRQLRFPREAFRVVANPPFNLTTDILKLILDRPSSSLLTRADLVLQRQVARKHAAQPPNAPSKLRAGHRGGSSRLADECRPLRFGLVRRSTQPSSRFFVATHPSCRHGWPKGSRTSSDRHGSRPTRTASSGDNRRGTPTQIASLSAKSEKQPTPGGMVDQWMRPA